MITIQLYSSISSSDFQRKMKFYVSVLVAVAVFGALHALALYRNDFIVGSLRPTSVLMFNQTYNRTGVPGQIVSQNVVFTGPSYRNISRIRAFDLNRNNTGGYVSIISGGINKRNVTLRLQASGVGRGYNFNIDIYGH